MEMKDLIYFDNSATTRVDPRVVEAMLPYFSDKYGNPSSAHLAGQIVHKDVEKAVETTAALINCAPQELIYMGSGSEADNFALIQTARLFKGNGRHLITSSVEHKAVLNTCKFLEGEGFDITYLPVNAKGAISVQELTAAIRPDTILISLMLANNEVGTLQPVREAADIAHKNNIIIHTDAVQAVGKMKIDVDELGVDMLTMTGHKIFAPKGIGVLYIKEELREQVQPLIHGGAQEGGKRAGTENVPYIIGMAAAASLIMEDGYEEVERVRTLRDLFETKILEEIPYTHVNGDTDNRIGSITNITFRFIEAEAVIGYVPEVCCSLGSACNASEEAASHVLTAMNLDPVDIRGTIRFSLGRFNTEEEVHRAVELLKNGVEKLRKMSPIYQQSTC